MSETFNQKFRRFNWDSTLKQIMFGIKIFVVVCLLISGFSNSVTGWAVQQIEVPCIEDQGFVLLSGINSYICSDDRLAFLLINSTSLACDFLFLTYAIRQLFWNPSIRPLIFFYSIYILSLITRHMFWPRRTEGSCWQDPVIPSLLFSQHNSPDFFFSSTAGVLYFFATENWLVKNMSLFVLSIFSIFLYCFSVVALRIDYSVSLLTGLTVGHYIWIISEVFERKINNYFR